MNDPNPSKRSCAIATEKCFKDAVEMRNGNMSTLSPSAAALPEGPKTDILGDRSRFASEWFETGIVPDKGKKLELRKTGAGVQKKVNQVLWLVADLERHLTVKL